MDKIARIGVVIILISLITSCNSSNEEFFFKNNITCEYQSSLGLIYNLNTDSIIVQSAPFIKKKLNLGLKERKKIAVLLNKITIENLPEITIVPQSISIMPPSNDVYIFKKENKELKEIYVSNLNYNDSVFTSREKAILKINVEIKNILLKNRYYNDIVKNKIKINSNLKGLKM